MIVNYINIYLIIGILIGFYLYKNICVYGYLKNNCKPKLNQIKINKNTTIHIHHWIIHTILLYFNYFKKNSINYYLYQGLNIGGIIHGIFTYNNWYKIIV
jgi:hypothetical protein